MNAPLGPCARCGIALVQTRYGAGHTSRPPASHYPIPVAPVVGRGGQTCTKGHEYTPENTYVRKDDGSRVCRKCRVVSVGVAKRAQRRTRKTNAVEYDDGFRKRFWAKVDKSGDCWEWTGGTRGGIDYGEIWHSPTAQMLVASRVSWELANDQPIPPGLFALHLCDNPPCVRPDHLYIGTKADNRRDYAERGSRRFPLVRPVIAAPVPDGGLGAALSGGPAVGSPAGSLRVRRSTR